MQCIEGNHISNRIYLHSFFCCFSNAGLFNFKQNVQYFTFWIHKKCVRTQNRQGIPVLIHFSCLMNVLIVDCIFLPKIIIIIIIRYNIEISVFYMWVFTIWVNVLLFKLGHWSFILDTYDSNKWEIFDSFFYSIDTY